MKEWSATLAHVAACEPFVYRPRMFWNFLDTRFITNTNCLAHEVNGSWLFLIVLESSMLVYTYPYYKLVLSYYKSVKWKFVQVQVNDKLCSYSNKVFVELVGPTSQVCTHNHKSHSTLDFSRKLRDVPKRSFSNLVLVITLWPKLYAFRVPNTKVPTKIRIKNFEPF